MSEEAATRLMRSGPNSIASRGTPLLAVLVRQVASPLLGLLVVAAAISYFVGDRSDAVIVASIVALSVTLGFVNEYHAVAGPLLPSPSRHDRVIPRIAEIGKREFSHYLSGAVREARPRRETAVTTSPVLSNTASVSAPDFCPPARQRRGSGSSNCHATE